MELITTKSNGDPYILLRTLVTEPEEVGLVVPTQSEEFEMEQRQLTEFDSQQQLYPMMVWGTLKRGNGNHSRHLHRSYFIGECHAPMFELHKRGLSTQFAEGITDHPVRGELYGIPNDEDFRSIDGLEGYPSFYNRSKTPVVVEDSVIIDAWIYFINYYRKSEPSQMGVYPQYENETQTDTRPRRRV